MCSKFETWKSNFKPKRSNPMSEGTTAIQVSPFNPGDREMAKTFFEQIANTVVDASELRKEVAELKHELEGIRADIQRVQDANFRMDQQITQLRSERDELQREVSEVQRINDDLTNSNARLGNRCDSLEQALYTMQAQRDEWQEKHKAELEAKEAAQIQVMELEETVKGLTGTLDGWRQRAEAAERDMETVRNVFTRR